MLPQTLGVNAGGSRPQPERIYYYHALDDQQRAGESGADFDSRVEKEKERFDRIAALPNFHIRLGSVTGKAIRRKRQKQVDVQLAVDALSHAFNKNVSLWTLVAGDLDFKPVVDALVSMGVFTEIVYEKESAAKDLYRAADISTPLAPIYVWNWSSAAYKKQYPLPIVRLGFPVSHLDGMEQLAVGNMNGAHARAARDHNGRYWVWVDSVHGRERFVCDYARFETLDTFLKYTYAPIEWAKGRERLPGNTKPPYSG